MKVDGLLAAALRMHPRVHNWWGIRGGATHKVAQCYICDAEITTWCGRYPRTKKADQAITDHANGHLRGWVSEEEECR